MANTDQRTIFIIPATNGAATTFLRNYDTKKIDYWVYLGRHATRCADIDAIIGSSIKKKEIGEELQNSAKAHRQNYINFIGNLAQYEKKPFWYLTSLSEKNPYISHFFLNFCFMQALITILSNNRHTICVFCESDALVRSLKKNLENIPHLNIACQVPPFPVLGGQLLSLSLLVKNKSWFFIRFLCRIIYARLHSKIGRYIQKNEGNSPDEFEDTIIHSWVDQRAFPGLGKYQDIYFGDLGERLRNNGVRVTYLLDILPAVWYPVAVKNMQSCNVRWCLCEEFLDFFDIFSAISIVYRQRTWISQTFILSELDVSDLVLEEKKQDYTNSRAELSYLSYCAGKKMCHTSVYNSFIYTFENHIWEKMIIEGIRSTCPGTKILGYAHSTVNRMDLPYSISSREMEFATLPDKILVNGIRAKQMLAEFGFASVPTVIIGAIRYGGLMTYNRVHDAGEKNRILVILSVNFGGSVEMILKCTEAFRNLDRVHITLKPHPAHKIADFSPYMTKVSGSFSWSSDPIQNLFEKTDLVIYTDSTASVEAAARGISLLHMKSSFAIDINIFEDSGIIPSANSPEQIRSFAVKILSGNEVSSNAIQVMIGELFAPMDEQKIMSCISAEKES